MKIYKQENALFDEWGTMVDGLIKDGVVDENEYIQAKYKIVFILKEVNGGKDWDLRDFVANGARSQTWDNIARWTEGILNIDKEFDWEYLENENLERRKKYLQKICAMNLKKTSGKHTADAKELEFATNRDSTFLKRQYKLYCPDISVCCGTAAEFFGEVYNEKPLEWLHTSRGIRYVRDNGMVIIDYAHPEARIKDCLLYYGLIDAVREILGISCVGKDTF